MERIGNGNTMIPHLPINHAHTPAFFEVLPPEKKKKCIYIYISLRSHAFILQVARHCQRAEERMVGGEKRSNGEKRNRNISANLA